MRCLAFRHLPHEGLGLLRPSLLAAGWSVEERDLQRPGDVPEEAAGPDVDLLIVLGGPMSAYETDRVSFLSRETEVLRRRLEAGRATLGICLGAQMMAAALGAKVYKGSQPEVGWSPVSLMPAGLEDPLLSRLLSPCPITLHWHVDTFDLPPGCTSLAQSERCKNQAFRHGLYSYAVQFHPEVPPEDLPIWTARSHIPLTGPPATPTAAEIIEGGEVQGSAYRKQATAFMEGYLELLKKGSTR